MSALVDALRAIVGEANVATSSDPRTAQHVSGLDVGVPLCWVRPSSSEECARVVSACAAVRTPIVPVGEATTFWDNLRVGGAVALDCTALRTPFAIDVERRIAHVGAGVPIREVDVAARARGLALRAHPDTSGDTPVGSIVAVGATAGLGMGRALPIDAFAGAVVVAGSGGVVRVGASMARGGVGFCREGVPDVSSLLIGAQGRAAVITEVALLLHPTPFTAVARWSFAPNDATLVDELLRLLRVARAAIDRASLETFRVECSAERRDALRGEVLVRGYSMQSERGASDAVDALLREANVSGVAVECETRASREGQSPDYDRRWSLPRGSHRASLRGAGFWGVEVTASWGDELRACIERMLDLCTRAADLDPIVRRFALYPSAHTVSIGTQVLVERTPDRIDALRTRLSEALPPLLALGVVPYRPGNLWREAMRDAVARDGDAGAALREAVYEAIDPHHIVHPTVAT